MISFYGEDDNDDCENHLIVRIIMIMLISVLIEVIIMNERVDRSLVLRGLVVLPPLLVACSCYN